MVTRGERYYWQVVLGVAVALVLIPSSKPDGEWLGIMSEWEGLHCRLSCDLPTAYVLPINFNPCAQFSAATHTKMVVLEPVRAKMMVFSSLE